MNIGSFVGPLVALLVAVVAGTRFLVTRRPRVQRLRSLFERLCLQLNPDQRAVYPDDRFAQFKDLIHPEVDALTAVNFLNDIDRGRGLLAQIDEVSPSMCFDPIMNRIGLAHGLAVVFAPILVSAFILIPPVSDIFGPKGGGGSAFLAIGIASAFCGVIISFIASVVVWSILFERDVSRFLVVIETQPLWGIGHSRRAVDRSMVHVKDDPMYLALRK
jgi:hypothetical protein